MVERTPPRGKKKMPLVELPVIDGHGIWGRAKVLRKPETAVDPSLAPAVHHGADVVTTITVYEHEVRFRKQAMEIRNAHGIDTGLLQYSAGTEMLVEIAHCRVTMLRLCVTGIGGLGFPVVVQGAMQAVPELGDLEAEGQEGL